MVSGYKLLAPIYRQIAEHRGYFIKQVALLEHIFELLGISSHSKILDAACGIGDVVCMLYYKGFKVFASDGSADMLRQWKPNAPHISCMRSDWSKLYKVFSKFGRFDVVYMLCNSIAHASSEIIQTRLFKHVFAGLRKEGVFIFDIRSWEKDSTGRIHEASRQTNVERVLQTVDLPDGRYWLRDKVSYAHNRQFVKYLLSKSSEPRRTRKTEIGYYMFDWNEVSEWLSNTGFQQIHTFKFPDWDYLVISGRK